MKREELLQEMDIYHIMFGMFFIFGNKLQTAGDHFYTEITSKQFFLLICLSIFKTEPTINDLAEVMGSTHQNVKAIADKLESKGYIHIYKDSSDKRKLRIGMTEKMGEMDAKYRKSHGEFMNRFYSGVSEKDLQTTYNTMIKLEDNLTELKEELMK